MDNVGRRVDGLGWEKGGWKRLREREVGRREKR